MTFRGLVIAKGLILGYIAFVIVVTAGFAVHALVW
jgi:hypothetical protein